MFKDMVLSTEKSNIVTTPTFSPAVRYGYELGIPREEHQEPPRLAINEKCGVPLQHNHLFIELAYAVHN